MEELEKRIQEAKRYLTKLNQDIDELNRQRSLLQNELDAKRKEAQNDIEIQKKISQEDINNKYSILKSERDNFNIEAEKKENELSLRENKLKNDEARVKFILDDLEIKWKGFEEEKQGIFAEIEKSLKTQQENLNKGNETLNQEKRELEERNTKLLDYKFNLDNQQFNLDYQQENIDKSARDLVIQQNLINETLKSINKTKEETEIKQIEINKTLSDITKQKEENERILKEIKLENDKSVSLKSEIEKSNKINAEQIKGLSRDKAILEEDKIYLDEQRRLFILESRKLDDKINTIKKLRDEIKNNPA